jgi:CheY-like chemotaxis protein
VLLPAHADAGAANAIDERKPIRPASLDGIRVLVVDDEDDAREILGRIIEDAGGVVTAVHSSRSALQALQEQRDRPQIVVTDIGMPIEDGYWLLKALRSASDAEVRALPVIALTAFATPHDRLRALAAGFAAHFSKPFEPAALLRAIMTTCRT